VNKINNISDSSSTACTRTVLWMYIYTSLLRERTQLDQSDTVKPLILAPLILAFLLAELLVIQYTKLPFQYDDDFIGMAASWLD